MTPPLPKQIREALGLAHKNMGSMQFHYVLLGAEWLYAHLTGLAEKGFDETAVDDEIQRLVNKDIPFNQTFGFSMGAIFQHAQTQALIALRDVEIADLKRQLLAWEKQASTLDGSTKDESKPGSLKL